MSTPWEIIATGMIGAVATSLAWIANPGQRRKDDADTQVSTGEAAESITRAARDIVDMTTTRLEAEVGELRHCRQELSVLRKENARLRDQHTCVVCHSDDSLSP